jgi:para-nitrobenzyl esterase
MHWLRVLAVLASAVFISGGANGAPVAPPTVRTAAGMVSGVNDGDVESFKGIPFAKPPLGPLRWRPPQPAAPWNGVRDASEFGPACMQGDRVLFAEDKVQSEDCLTLNIWRPSNAQPRKLPVMVWIYGGGFSMGSTRPPLYAGANFARVGVVLVSIQYRVGRFGFFAHPALTREDPRGLLGNFAIMDQIAALKWVKHNIAAFGGDPDNVTIFGESAGGISINALMATEAAGGLFQKAISESGFGRTVGIPIAAAEAQGVAFAEAQNIKDGPGAAAALRALPAAAILSAPTLPGPPSRQAASASGATPSAAPRQHGGAPGGLPYPLIDGVLFKEQISETFAAGRQAHVPYLAGGNSYEAILFSFVRNAPQRVFDQTGDAARAAALYVTPTRDAGLGALDLVTDLQVTEPARYLAQQVVKAGQPAYLYYFSYLPPPMRWTLPGVPHGGELGYVFGVLAPTAPPDAVALSKAIRAYWVAFAKTGNPNAAGGPAWKPVTSRGYGYMELGDDGPVMRPDFNKLKLEFIAGLPGK